mmetsp:Transcript_21224/g.36359  ORF Transcript_21224/g.36359 Transcript_21224/m.36359 type:complete len:445 (+) Transcript_21224:66-1400(+)
MSQHIKNLMEIIKKRDPNEKEFHQAVEEVLNSLQDVFEEDESYVEVMERILEPERMIMFRVAWTDDNGKQHVNRGYRVQFNGAIGPYKGGLRFSPGVCLSVIKFLAYEQTFKNALTNLPLGSGKGGSDFDPKGKSDNEVMRFCQAFMTELAKHIGPNVDVPAGDIGVGGREIGYLFGQYRRMTNHNEGVLTGKGLGWGGSKIRTEATGYGLVYIAKEILKRNSDDIKGKRVVVSGAGNVAQYTLKKLIELGAKPITASDSGGYIYEEDGIDEEGLNIIFKIKNNRGRIKEYVEERKNAKYFEGKKPWDQKCDIAMPCATQNEIEEDDAKQLSENGCKFVFEGANMPTTSEAVCVFRKNNVTYVPGKACNAGGVATSGLEMAQNSIRQYWNAEEVDSKLEHIMCEIVDQMESACKKYNKEGDYQAGANIAGFLKVADSMKAQGIF